jgi:hypothetical protein
MTASHSKWFSGAVVICSCLLVFEISPCMFESPGWVFFSYFAWTTFEPTCV